MVLESVTLGMLSSLCYDVIKHSGHYAKDKFLSSFGKKYPAQNNEKLELLASEIEELRLNDEMSEKAILKKLEASQTIRELTAQIELKTQINISQHHSGKGDNIAGDKVINVTKSD